MNALTLAGFACVGLGAAFGAWLRWLLALRYNAPLAAIPYGTLAANLLGGYLIGIALAAFAAKPEIAPEWRLFIVTGLLGGLTTFSTYSAEVIAQLQRQGWLAAALLAGLHLVGSLSLTAAGIASWNWFAAGRG